MIKRITYRDSKGRKHSDYVIMPSTYAHLSIYNPDKMTFRSHWTNMDKNLTGIDDRCIRFAGTKYVLHYSDGTYENVYVKNSDHLSIMMNTTR